MKTISIMLQNFNSCMVQLKCVQKGEPLSAATVLIPVWCNWNCPTYSNSLLKKIVLIPVWCNWNARLGAKGGAIHDVLIPVWCNWNEGKQDQHGQIVVGFNSCMVQLKYEVFNRLAAENFSFNSCMVQLKLIACTSAIACSNVLIPVWCNWNWYL